MPRVIHFEIGADDPERAAEFYRQLFGWKINKWEGPIEYWLTESGGEGEPGIDGGIMPREHPGMNTVNTIGVDSIDTYLAKVPQHGGKVLTEKMSIPGVGWSAYCQDSEGNMFGLFESDENAGK